MRENKVMLDSYIGLLLAKLRLCRFSNRLGVDALTIQIH